MVFVPLHGPSKPPVVHESGGAPPCMPQCAGASVGAMDSKLLKPVAPNSLVKTDGNARPLGVAGLRAIGKPESNGARSLPPPPLTAGKPEPCW